MYAVYFKIYPSISDASGMQVNGRKMLLIIRGLFLTQIKVLFGLDTSMRYNYKINKLQNTGESTISSLSSNNRTRIELVSSL